LPHFLLIRIVIIVIGEQRRWGGKYARSAGKVGMRKKLGKNRHVSRSK
jgi:hypothetical protein